MGDRSEVELYHLNARCPECGGPVRLRNSSAALTLVKLAREMGWSEETVLQTYQCSTKDRYGRHCNMIFGIRLKDWGLIKD